MAGYIRADVTSQIADGNPIDALPLNQEFDAVEAAFDVVSGHRHDGTSAEGAPITVVGPAQDIVVTATVLRPKTDNTVDLGTSSLEFKDLWIDGTANIDSLVSDSVTIGAGTFTGILQFNGTQTNFNGSQTSFTGTLVDFDVTQISFRSSPWTFSGSTADRRAALGAATTPQTTVGVGQFVVLSAAANTNLVLPGSGSWLWWIIQRNSSTLVVNDVSTGVSAGASTIFAATAGVDTRGWAWRIA